MRVTLVPSPWLLVASHELHGQQTVQRGNRRLFKFDVYASISTDYAKNDKNMKLSFSAGAACQKSVGRLQTWGIPSWFMGVKPVLEIASLCEKNWVAARSARK